MNPPDSKNGEKPAAEEASGAKVEAPRGGKIHTPASTVATSKPKDATGAEAAVKPEVEKTPPVATETPASAPQTPGATTATKSSDGAPPPPPVPGWLHQTATWSSHHIGANARRIWSRRGAPAVLFGLALIVLGATLDSLTSMKIPIIAIGVVLFVFGILGPRLRMRFGLRLEDEGLDISMQLGVAARPEFVAGPKHDALPPPVAPAPADRIEAPAPEAVPEVLESTAETISFDAELIRAAALKADRESSS